MNEAAGDAGYAYGDVPPAYEFSDPAIPCVIPDANDVRMSPSEEQLLHHSMAHPWTTTPYNVTDRSGQSARATTWRSIQAAAGAVVVSALLVPFGAGFMVIEAGSFGVGSFGLLMVTDFMLRVGAASLNRRRVDRVTKTSTIANSHETYTTSPRLNRPRLPECSVTVVGYRENEAAWENCLESIKAQQYPVKHIVAVIDGNQLPDMAMVSTFSNAFAEKERLTLPTRYESFKAWWAGSSTAGHAEAHDAALNYVLDYVYTKATIQKWTQYRALCFTQPHAHKRHAMFTAFIVGTYALGTKDAILTTDSDARLDPAAASNLMAMLYSDAEIAAVTGDVDVDRRESSFPNVYALSNWFSSNVDAPCQSFFGSVSRLSSPMALYRVSDLMDVVSPWIMQTHFGKHVVTGEDHHLATELLSKGLKTAHTHAAKAYTDAPSSYVRWIKQQTRWSRASYREALFSSPRLNNTNPWLAVEATKDLYFPLVLVASVLYLLFTPTHWEHLPIFLATIAGAVAVKTLYAVVASRDLRLALYPVNQAMFFLGVVPSRVFALVTTYITRSECFYSRTKHVGHLLVWYAVLCMGLASYLATARAQPSLWLVAILGPALALHAYADVFAAKTRFFVHAPRHLLQSRAKAFDIEAEAASPIAAGRRSSIVKPLRKDSAYEDEQFEAQTAAIPLDPMRKGSVLYGDVMEKVFSCDSRRPSMM
ncbi:uncharacterized protein TRAVEDRAFT_137322 [Trametes versicolor FP-101664 SS1]|uniref:Glycosyltransferase 2-like domain-containing protein n=1 Tax=Trametes versicolor (strain FP-101664) TaxID=717944 RepID=R7S7E2_TRAVS|nr:uncharacterized protein TRAVEDRAFT_137322 [Trametes versicolor FP-101664 SS1]EIW51535.1 hypothetical protein TRAVEDRAFT_137322 [Trametes versicolor FP-101664 SS1]